VGAAIRNAVLNIFLRAINGFHNAVENAVEILTGLGITFDVFVNGVHVVLRPFAFTIIGICLLIELAQMAQRADMIKIEHMVRIATKIVLAVVFIDFLPLLMQAIYAQAAAWVNAIGINTAGFSVETITNLIILINNVSGLGASLALLASSLILALAIWIAGIMIQIVAIGRIFEIYILVAISPLPAAFFPLGSGDGTGFSRISLKFIRMFAAVCLQGVMMILCLNIFGLIMSTLINNAAASAMAGSGANPTADVMALALAMVMGSIVLVMSVSKAGTWAKSIMDAA